MKSSKVEFYAALTSFCSRQPKIFSINHAFIPLSLFSSLFCLLKCSVTFVIASPGTNSIYTTHQQTLYFNHELSDSLNMFIFLLPWSCLQVIDFHLTAICLRKGALYKFLYFFADYFLFCSACLSCCFST